MKNKSNKTETVFYLFIKTYIELICVLVVSLVLLLVLVSFFFGKLTESRLPNIGVYDKIRKNYEAFDTRELEEMGGGFEVVDENNKVIFRKGNVGKKKETYTQEELLKLSYLSYIESSKELHILNGFISSSGKKYISIITLPSNNIKLNFQFSSKYMYLFKGIKSKLIISLILFIAIVIFSIGLFSYLISIRLGKPLKKIEEGLVSIGNGNYKDRLKFNGPKEFDIIKDTFNEILDKLSKAEDEKRMLEDSKKMLLADLTHDIKSPITSIKGFSQALVEGRIDDEDKDRYYKVINRKSDEVVEMIDELFQYVKMDTPDFKLNMQKKDICEVLRRLIVKYYDDIKNKGMELEFFIPEEKIYVKIDEINLFRALGNLVDNVLKCNKAGTRIKIELSKDQIYGKYIEKNEKVVFIRVCDDGIGIKNKDIIFDPFVREDKSRKNDGGTWLGLSIVKKIIELHGGKIGITENVEYKTIFEIALYENVCY